MPHELWTPGVNPGVMRGVIGCAALRIRRVSCVCVCMRLVFACALHVTCVQVRDVRAAFWHIRRNIWGGGRGLTYKEKAVWRQVHATFGVRSVQCNRRIRRVACEATGAYAAYTGHGKPSAFSVLRAVGCAAGNVPHNRQLCRKSTWL